MGETMLGNLISLANDEKVDGVIHTHVIEEHDNNEEEEEKHIANEFAQSVFGSKRFLSIASNKEL